MGGGTTQQSGTTTQVNQIPAWMSDAGQQNYAFAQKVAEQPLQQYQGQMVADTSPQTQQSWDVAANSGNVGGDQYNAGTAGYLGALAQNPMQVSSPGNANAVNAGQISNTNLDPYMNPYTKDVINATLPIMQQQNALSQNQQGNQANAANAFGGSRQGIQQGVAQAQGAQNIGQMLAGLNSANFTQAQAAATGDINRNLQAQTTNQTSQQTDLARQQAANLANQSAQQQKINSDIVASQGLTNTGDSMNKANTANFNMLQSAGASQSMQAQNDINAQMAKFNQAFNYPQQQLGTLLSALGMTPHDTSSSGQSTQQTTTPTDWASIIKGGAQTAASLYGMSDKSMKTDITKLGKDKDTGLQMHAFRYKGDPKSYPKVVGPMAQEVQEKYPDKVKRQGGKLTVSPDIMPRGYAGGTSYVARDYAGEPGMTQSGLMNDVVQPRGGVDPTYWLHRALGAKGQGPNVFTKPEDYTPPRSYAGGTPFVQPDMQPPDPSEAGPPPYEDWNQAVRESPLSSWQKKQAEIHQPSPRKYAAGTPSVAAFTPPSSPSVAKGIGALSAFAPKIKMPRGATVAKMPKGFAFGTSDVPDVDFSGLTDEDIMGGGGGGGPDWKKAADSLPDSSGGDGKAPPEMKKSASKGWDAPSMGYSVSGFAFGSPSVPNFGPTDTVPAMLSPGEAVLTPGAAQHVGRSKIASLNAMMPPTRGQATAMPRAGARGIQGALANTKLKPKIMGGLSG